MKRNNSYSVPSFYKNNCNTRYLITQSKEAKMSTLFYELKKEHSPEFKIKEAKRKVLNFQLSLLDEHKKLLKRKSNQKLMKQLNNLFDKFDKYNPENGSEAENYFNDYINELNKYSDKDCNLFPTSLNSIKNVIKKETEELRNLSNDTKNMNYNLEHRYNIKFDKNEGYTNMANNEFFYRGFYYLNGNNKNRSKAKDIFPHVKYFEFKPCFTKDRIEQKKLMHLKNLEMIKVMSMKDKFQNPIFIKDKFSY